MMHTRVIVCLCICFCTLAYSATPNPSRFLNFLVKNTWNTSSLPLSYRVPYGYWKNIKPEDYYNTSINDPTPCGREITPTEMDNYRAQTEQMLTTYGLDIYDAAVREIALAVLGQVSVAQEYETNTLIAAKTFQFANIRASAACNGIMYEGKCKDPMQTGACGFCYGPNGVTLSQNAYFFRLISDIWGFQGTVDQRCPEKNIEWTWNDYRPVTGENVWANFLGPLQVAYIQVSGNVENIPDSSNAMKLAVTMFSAMQAMVMPNGAIAYAPWNTYDFVQPALGATVSIENCASSLASLKAFLFVLQNNPTTQYKSLIPQVQTMISGLQNFLKSAFDTNMNYFYQGGILLNGTWTWNDDPVSDFAVDCQTWVVSVLGAPLIDSWFGVNTSLKIWNTTKQIGGYLYNPNDNSIQGLGFSTNKAVQVFSGEWTLGGINMLRILAKQYTDPAVQQALTNEAFFLRQSIEGRLTYTDNNLNSATVWYANKRYYIPWGWYANPIPALASTAWAVLLDSNFNPFLLGGAYV